MNSFYSQIDGCSMGAPLSALLAQLVMEDLEETIINKIKHKISFFKRYVDDCLTAVSEADILLILNELNNYHPKIKFTTEIEKDNRINFLDMTLIHNIMNSKIETIWHTKETWSGRYLNYKSIAPIQYKKSVISGIADRSIKLTSPKYRIETIKKAKKILNQNNYPSNLIEKIFKNRIHSAYNTIENEATKGNKKYVAIPYVKNLSEKINYIFKDTDIKIAHKSKNNLKHLYTKLKSKIPKDKISNCVYKLKCKECSGVYIGQTTQYIKERINGHKYAKNSTALKKHELTTNHGFDFDNCEILHKETNSKIRTFLEMIYIQKEKNSINDRTDLKNLAKIYHNILQ